MSGWPGSPGFARARLRPRWWRSGLARRSPRSSSRRSVSKAYRGALEKEKLEVLNVVNVDEGAIAARGAGHDHRDGRRPAGIHAARLPRPADPGGAGRADRRRDRRRHPGPSLRRRRFQARGARRRGRATTSSWPTRASVGRPADRRDGAATSSSMPRSRRPGRRSKAPRRASFPGWARSSRVSRPGQEDGLHHLPGGFRARARPGGQGGRLRPRGSGGAGADPARRWTRPSSRRTRSTTWRA